MTDGPTYLATLDVDGTVSPIPQSADVFPALYGPDGVTLVFLTIAQSDGSYSQTVGTMHDDGSLRRTIVSLPNANIASLADPSFSFDGQLITYLQCDEHPNCMINVVNVASLEVRTVEASRTDKASPRFTPDGAGIVYYENNCNATLCYGALQYVDVVTSAVSTLYKSENNFAPLSISSAVDNNQ
jgi:Tol biopolymer transport system component